MFLMDLQIYFDCTKEILIHRSEALGVDSEPLMRLQTKYNMLTIKQDKSFMERLLNCAI